MTAALSESQRTALSRRTPIEAIQYRQGPGGTTLAYVSHAWVTAQLNEAFGGNWGFEILEWQLFPSAQQPDEAVVRGRLTVHTESGIITKTQFGQVQIKKSKGAPISIGDDLKGAASDALRKAATLFGIGLDLMSKAEREITTSPARTAYWDAVKKESLPEDRAAAGEAWALAQEDWAGAFRRALSGLRAEVKKQQASPTTPTGEAVNPATGEIAERAKPDLKVVRRPPLASVEQAVSQVAQRTRDATQPVWERWAQVSGYARDVGLSPATLPSDTPLKDVVQAGRQLVAEIKAHVKKRHSDLDWDLAQSGSFVALPALPADDAGVEAWAELGVELATIQPGGAVTLTG